MRRLIGYSSFLIGLGMFLMLFIKNILVAIILIGILMILGYNLFCSS